jgi:hypothetical protein
MRRRENDSAQHGAGVDRVGASWIGSCQMKNGEGLPDSARQLSLSLGVLKPMQSIDSCSIQVKRHLKSNQDAPARPVKKKNGGYVLASLKHRHYAII